MAGTSKRGKAVVEGVEEEDELNPRSKSRARKQYSPYAQTKELSPPEEPRRHHLLISNGGAICFLDLEQSKDKQPLINADYVPPLPIIASLNLMENHLPVLAGLFKAGSDAYLIGGRKLTQKQAAPSLNEWPEVLKGTSRSRTIYRLSLNNDNDNDNDNDNHNHNTFIITASKAKAKADMMMKKLKSPKIWPIVEEIDGQIHAFDSAFHTWSKPRRDWMFSHEVLNTKSKIGVVDLPPVLNQGLIKSHLVLGKRIYAVMEQSGKHLVFDSETNKWESIGGPGRQCPSWIQPQHACDILDNAIIASCVGEFPPYYVVIGIFEHRSFDESNYYYVDLDGVYAGAFIVRGATGEVVCRQQPLPRFFQGPVQPHRLRGGKVIKVDEEGKTMCAILNAHAILNGCEYDSAGGYLFIYTFRVGILACAVDVDEKLNLEELVRVFPKQRFVYKTNARRQEEDKGIHDPDFTDFQAIQACFV